MAYNRQWVARRRQQYYKKYLQWYDAPPTESGFRPVVFDYNYELQKEFVELMYEAALENFFYKKEVKAIVMKNTGMTPHQFDSFVSGKRSLGAWEMRMIAELFGIVIRLYKHTTSEKRYRYYLDGKDKEFLVLQSLRMPKFWISFNREDLYDFDVDFSEDRNIRFLNKEDITDYKIYNHIRRLVEWYFIKNTDAKKLPFDKKKFKALVYAKFHNNEMNVLHGNTIATKAKYDLSEEQLENFDDAEFDDSEELDDE